MAGRPRKFIAAYYDVLEAQKAENVTVGIIGLQAKDYDLVQCLRLPDALNDVVRHL